MLVRVLALTSIRKSFNLEISIFFIFYARELHLVSKCRQMNKLYCEIINVRGKYIKKKKKTKYYELKSPIRGKLTLSLAFVGIAQMW